MSEIGKIPDNTLQSLQAPAGSEQKTDNDLSKDAFMALMLAQLKNQNPMEPMTNGEFLTQIAQFNSANGISDLQESFAAFAGSMQSQQALQAATMVGREVVVPSERLHLDGGNGVTAHLEIPAASERVSVEIATPQGNVLRRLDLGSQPPGMTSFTWDGLDDRGNPVNPGTFVVSASSSNQGESTAVRMMVTATVESVMLGRNGGATVLNLQNVGPTPLTQVIEVR